MKIHDSCRISALKLHQGVKERQLHGNADIEGTPGKAILDQCEQYLS